MEPSPSYISQHLASSLLLGCSHSSSSSSSSSPTASSTAPQPIVWKRIGSLGGSIGKVVGASLVSTIALLCIGLEIRRGVNTLQAGMNIRPGLDRGMMPCLVVLPRLPRQSEHELFSFYRFITAFRQSEQEQLSREQ